MSEYNLLMSIGLAELIVGSMWSAYTAIAVRNPPRLRVDNALTMSGILLMLIIFLVHKLSI